MCAVFLMGDVYFYGRKLYIYIVFMFTLSIHLSLSVVVGVLALISKSYIGVCYMCDCSCSHFLEGLLTPTCHLCEYS